MSFWACRNVGSAGSTASILPTAEKYHAPVGTGGGRDGLLDAQARQLTHQAPLPTRPQRGHIVTLKPPAQHFANEELSLSRRDVCAFARRSDADLGLRGQCGNVSRTHGRKFSTSGCQLDNDVAGSFQIADGTLALEFLADVPAAGVSGVTLETRPLVSPHDGCGFSRLFATRTKNAEYPSSTLCAASPEAPRPSENNKTRSAPDDSGDTTHLGSLAS
jgi:hypothetical protein